MKMSLTGRRSLRKKKKKNEKIYIISILFLIFYLILPYELHNLGEKYNYSTSVDDFEITTSSSPLPLSRRASLSLIK